MRFMNKHDLEHSHYWQRIPFIAELLFVLGLIGGVSFRLTIFLKPLGDQAVNTAWYSGIIAYIIFFYVRISIENHRREICTDRFLFERLAGNDLTEMDVKNISSILKSQCKSNIKYIYIVWFGLSVVSLIAAILFV